MFTGIVQQRGRVAQVEQTGGFGRLTVATEAWDRPLEIGESIAVMGVCLTLTQVRENLMAFDVLQETFERTNLGEKGVGAAVNLERALRVGDALGGHFVTGHVDGTGDVCSLTPKGRDWVLDVACPPELLSGMVPKGSIAIDGISLTIVDLWADHFTVHLIPHTYDVTSVRDLRRGQRVNLETDMLGKYVKRLLETAPGAGAITREKLRDCGFPA